MELLFIGVTALLVSGLTLVSGFGLGTILMAVFALMAKRADKRVVARFSVPAAAAAVVRCNRPQSVRRYARDRALRRRRIDLRDHCRQIRLARTMPVKTGSSRKQFFDWIPACAGMTICWILALVQTSLISFPGETTAPLFGCRSLRLRRLRSAWSRRST
jgi:hypothetical protein